MFYPSQFQQEGCRILQTPPNMAKSVCQIDNQWKTLEGQHTTITNTNTGFKRPRPAATDIQSLLAATTLLDLAVPQFAVG